MSSNRELKLVYLERVGVCFWCREPVKDYGNLFKRKNPPDMATIDHLKSRFFRKKDECVDKVLSCRECNQKRARVEEFEQRYVVAI